MEALKKYYFQLGYSCNNNCWHCFLPKSEHQTELNTKQIKSTLLEAKKNGVNIIALTGGEPTIRDDIFDVIKYCKKLKFEQIGLQTNGRLCFYKKFARKIVEAGVTDVYVSFHSHKPDVQNYITRSPESFSQSSGGNKKFSKLGC
ncbi:MAG: radical SAM protein [Candidatus Anstonellales archaeon]